MWQDHVCTRQGVTIPWDAVAQEIREDLSAEAIKQHLSKLCKFRAAHGQQIPKKLEKAIRRKAGNQASGGPAAVRFLKKDILRSS